MERKSKAGPVELAAGRRKAHRQEPKHSCESQEATATAEQARGQPAAWGCMSLGAPSSQRQEGDCGSPSSQTTRDHRGEGLRGGPRASRPRAAVRVHQEALPTPPPNSSSAGTQLP